MIAMTRRDRWSIGGVLLVAIGACAGGRPGVAAEDGPVTNVRVTEWSKTAAILTFDVGWKNSWRHEGNHDALWVFFKYRPEGSDEWRHLRLAADKTVNPTGYGQAGGTRVDLIVPDGDDGFLGMLVRRADYGLGPIAATGVTARWDLAAAPGISPDQKISFLAVGIEMAYVPEGAFVLGGGSEPLHFYEYTDGWQHQKPYRVAAAGRRFRGTHGRGTPALPADWPQADAAGSGIRGGHGRSGNPSYRLNAADGSATRAPGVGWRGARSAPRGVGL